MRKQYHFWPGAQGLDAWDVDRLIRLSAGLPVNDVPVDSIADVDTAYWATPGAPYPTVREFVEQMRLVVDVDSSYPVILGSDGRLMDGMHRVARALLQGRTAVPAVQFPVDPEPDFRDTHPDDLSYEEEPPTP